MDTGLRSGLVDVSASLPTFASVGVERRAEEIGRIAASSFEYLAALLERRPEIQVLVLSEADWPAKGRAPLFGLPNAEDGTLVVAGTEAPFWAQLAPMAGEAGQAELVATYAGPDGVIRLGAFFDLVAVHEVAHLFTERVVGFPRLWLAEFFANLCLHAWVERRAPASLSTLLTLPRLAAQAPATAFDCRTRDDFERSYVSMTGPNYVWYQFRLQVAGAALFQAAGEAMILRLFDAYRFEDGATALDIAESQDLSIDDETIAARLSEAVDPGLGAFSLEF